MTKVRDQHPFFKYPEEKKPFVGIPPERYHADVVCRTGDEYKDTWICLSDLIHDSKSSSNFPHKLVTMLPRHDGDFSVRRESSGVNRCVH